MRTSNLAEVLIEYPLPRHGASETSAPEKIDVERLDFGTGAEPFRSATNARNATFTYRLSSTTQPAQQQGHLEALPAAINGAVLSIEGESVIAELHTAEAKVVRVRMPRALFPDEIGLGTPITLRLDTSSGVRVPIITLRDLPRQSDDEELAGLRAIVSTL